MPALSLGLTEFSNTEHSRTWTLSGHTAIRNALVKQTRKLPASVSANAENRIQVVRTTTDAAGILLPNKVAILCDARYPIAGSNVDLDLAIADFRALVASDEFVVAIKTLNFVKG